MRLSRRSRWFPFLLPLIVVTFVAGGVVAIGSSLLAIASVSEALAVGLALVYTLAILFVAAALSRP